MAKIQPKSRAKPAKRKAIIPAAFREQIWLRTFGETFKAKCPTPWCQNDINVFTFQSGHNIAESKGGPTIPSNLIPICARCNLSMGDRYTFDEWAAIGAAPVAVPIAVQPAEPVQQPKKPWWLCC